MPSATAVYFVRTRASSAERRVPRIIVRLRAMLVWDELRRTRQGAWPPAITLPQLHALAEPGKES
jgi:hypothetical protein